jgi:hypothetical protein
MSPSAEWEAAYEITVRDRGAALDILDELRTWPLLTEALNRVAVSPSGYAALRNTIARIIGIAIARAIEAEIAPEEAV